MIVPGQSEGEADPLYAAFDRLDRSLQELQGHVDDLIGEQIRCRYASRPLLFADLIENPETVSERDVSDLLVRSVADGRLTESEARRVVWADIVIGSDVPGLTRDHLKKAVRRLAAGCHAVLSPAEDGGYALIGLRRLEPRLFQGMQWGGADVYARTATALGLLGLRWQPLGTVWDVDRPEELDRLRAIRLHRSFSAGPRAVRR